MCVNKIHANRIMYLPLSWVAFLYSEEHLQMFSGLPSKGHPITQWGQSEKDVKINLMDLTLHFCLNQYTS